MARPVKVTQEIVNATADNLVARGLKPTVRSVLAETGGGSEQVHAMLDVWKGLRKEPPTPRAVPDAVFRCLQNYVDDMVNAETAVIVAERDEAREQVAELTVDFDGQARRLAEVEEELQAQRSRADASAAQHAAATEALALEREKSTDLAARYETLSNELAVARANITRLAALEEHLTALKKELTTAHSQRESAEQRAAVSSALLEHVKGQPEQASARKTGRPHVGN